MDKFIKFLKKPIVWVIGAIVCVIIALVLRRRVKLKR
jgi:hypothetical protein